MLVRRIDERFPGSGLSRVATELEALAGDTEVVLEELKRPMLWLRALTVVAVVALIAVLTFAVVSIVRLADTGMRVGLPDVLQGLDAAVNELIVLGVAVIFLVTLESRFKRRKALAMLYRLRGIAHVVDMHQLTKDPEHVLRPVESTASSPVRTLSRGELVRYLDYCSELLAIVSKLAALHANHIQDSVVLAAVNDVESLATGLSGKIWQKIMILDIAADRGVTAPAR